MTEIELPNHWRLMFKVVFVALCMNSSPFFASAQQQIAPAQVNVVALMVEFQPDTTRFTTGDGRFSGSLFEGVEPPRIDPLPHDADYFEAHLSFLRNYVSKVSDGRTEVTTFVIPEIVTLDGKMGQYSPTGFDSGSDIELSKMSALVAEAWSKAEAAGSEVPDEFSASNTAFLVFHAGVGRDIELVGTTLDKTPEDLPSLYFGPETLERLGVSGLELDGLPVSNTLVIPRTESRLGFNFLTDEPFLVELSINGMLAASFLNYLGVPDLFNTSTGESAIGPFGVMDALGIFAYSGLFPPEPSAWTKYYLGWGDVFEAEPGVNELVHTGDASNNQIARVNLSASEYYLLENRHRDPETDGVRLTVLKDGQVQEVRFPNADPEFNDQTIEGFEGGVVLDVDQFDFALPGGVDENDNALIGGLLIWHIDENRLVTRLNDNSVNADPEKRAIDLEEADGAQDIGYSSGASFFGPRYDLGSPFDFWFESNPVLVRTATGQDIQLYENRFGEDTYPSSLTNAGLPSGITISEISEPGSTLSFSFERETVGVWNSTGIIKNALPADLFGGNGRMGVVRGESLYFLAEKEGGKAAFGSINGSYADGLLYGGPIVLPTNDLILIAPEVFVALTSNGDLEQSIVQGTMGMTVSSLTSNMSWHAEGNSFVVRIGVTTPMGPAMAIAQRESSGTFSSRIEPLQNEILGIIQLERSADAGLIISDHAVFDERTGKTHVLDLSGSHPARFDAALSEEGWVLSWSSSNPSALHLLHENGQQFSSPLSGSSACTVGDPIAFDREKDGIPEFLIACGDHVFGFHANGTLMDDYPFQAFGQVLSDLIVVESPELNQQMALFQTSEGSLDGIELEGDVRRSEGFPLSSGHASTIAPTVIVSPETQDLGLSPIFLSLSNQGALSGWVAADNRSIVSRPRSSFDLAVDVREGSTPGTEPSSRLLLADETYNWPNPILDGITHIRYMVDEVSDINILIVDGAGSLVHKAEIQSVSAGVPAEYIWETNAQSGLYFARVKATSISGREDMMLVKMALIR